MGHKRFIERIERALWASCILAICAASVARGQNMVYHSPNDDSVDPGVTVQLPIGPSESLFLYLNPGEDISQSGTPCFDGTGRELCAYEVTVDAVGGADFVDFIPQTGVVHLLTPTQLKANGLFASTPTLGAVRIGELKVAFSDVASEVIINGGQVVLAALQTESISQSVMANVPEPGFGGALLVATLGLAAAGRSARRRRRERSR